MLIVRQIVKLEDGSYDTSWNLSEQQMNFLLTYAINSLVVEGLVQIEDKETDERQLQIDFLSAVDPKDIPQA